MNEELLKAFELKNIAGSMFKMLSPLWPLFVISIVFPILLKILELWIRQKQSKYFLRKHKAEITTFFFAVIGYVVSYMLLDHPGWVFLLSITVTFVATIIIVYIKVQEKDFYFISLRKNSDKEDWMGDGVFSYDRVHKAYTITNSSSGFIFSKCLAWSDYVVDFEFKILNKSLGVILRATNLSNLVMMQIFEDGIKAHIKINGFWQSWSPASENLSFEKKLNLDKWYRGRFYCDKGSILMRIYDMQGRQLFDRSWKIPTGAITFYYNDPLKEESSSKPPASSIPFPINLEYGTIGFRNDGKENALVENVLIEKLK